MSFDPYLDAVALARAYQNKEASVRETVEALLARIDKHDPKLGAFQALYADEARAAAEAADRAMENGHRVGPFHGIPFALKDIIDVEGRITTGGSAAMADRVSPSTGTIARRLLSAGGILVGKTKTVEVAMGGWGTNQRMGTPWNPWDLETHRTPGGSSSGSGVAIAAGLVTCAVGTDTGGSVRGPSAWNGIVGLKVTEGFLPTDGIIPYSHTLDTPGPMVRSVRDAAFMFDVMAGHEAYELEAHLADPGALSTSPSMGIKGFRLGTLTDRDRELLDEDILALYDAALVQLRSLGAEIVPFEPPIDYDAMAEANGFVFSAEGFTHHGKMMEDLDSPVDEDVRPRVLQGRDIAAHEYIGAMLKRQEHIALFLEHLRGLAGVVTPTIRTAAIPISDADQKSTPAFLTRPFNYLAMCALSIPMGLTPGGLPGGLQIVARGGDEATALRIGAAYERAHGGIGHPDL
tara:strand:- start:9 stop:1394 length:1386 start_codon:yes stop_codon:yes gene_type:complete